MLSPGEYNVFTEHLSTCKHCREKVDSNKYVNELIIKCDIPVPSIDITKAVMDKIRSEQVLVHRPETVKKPGLGHQRFTSLLQDLVAAAAAAMIIFWLTGPVLAGTEVPQYSQKVTKVSNSVGLVFEGYLNFYDRAMDKFSISIDEIHRWK
jgi:hypothetical protein